MQTLHIKEQFISQYQGYFYFWLISAGGPGKLLSKKVKLIFIKIDLFMKKIFFALPCTQGYPMYRSFLVKIPKMCFKNLHQTINGSFPIRFCLLAMILISVNN